MRQLKITKSITNRESASLDKYLQEIGKEELITVEEEVELAQRIKKGDQEALEKLTKANLRFVVSVAKQYQNQGLSLPDLINEGNLGLIKAAGEVRRNARFQVHLLRRVVDSPVDPSGLGRAVAHRASAAQPGGVAQQDQQGVRPFRAGARAYAVARGAGQRNWTCRRRRSPTRCVCRAATSRSTLRSPTARTTSLLDVLVNPDSPNADRGLINESLSTEVDRALETLTERERDIIKLLLRHRTVRR